MIITLPSNGFFTCKRFHSLFCKSSISTITCRHLIICLPLEFLQTSNPLFSIYQICIVSNSFHFSIYPSKRILLDIFTEQIGQIRFVTIHTAKHPTSIWNIVFMDDTYLVVKTSHSIYQYETKQKKPINIDQQQLSLGNNRSNSVPNNNTTTTLYSVDNTVFVS